MNPTDGPDEAADGDVAIVGIACRFPGAASPDAFWTNLAEGRHSMRLLSRDEARAAGAPDAWLDDPRFVAIDPRLEGTDLFDAAFFNLSPRDAELLDPQQRLLLECAWHAMEDAGCVADGGANRVAVYAGVGSPLYVLGLLRGDATLGIIDGLALASANDKDYVATRVAYKLDLRGPAMTIQTACSTSLVAVHVACQALLSGECDAALVGACTLQTGTTPGYHAVEGVLSADGRVRAFDAAASGVVVSSGVGVVVLKRLADARAAGDAIYAVIKGSAINNDGAAKVSYAAPSVEGQARVIEEALAVAGVAAESISYVEAHGTATALGDAIEVAALTRAFRASTDAVQFCGLGSVKSNIGHTDTAAGIANLIKVALALRHGLIPPSLHVERPNPQLGLERGPFYVNTRLAPWLRRGSAPRRAGVSAFGIGGTNAHVIVEEAPARAPGGPAAPWQVLALSARTPSALDAATAALARHLREHPEVPLADVAYTLAVGRARFEHRRVVVCSDVPDAVAALASGDAARVHARADATDDRPVVFMFPGAGAQHVDMAAEFYRARPVFREAFDRCADVVTAQRGIDLRGALFSAHGAVAEGDALARPAVFLPVIFAVEYALAQLWMAWGVKPAALVGHSVGEYVAATLAGVMSLDDALRLVALRGQLTEELPPAAMMAVALPEAELAALLPEGAEISVVNGPEACVVSGPPAAIDALAARLGARGVEGQRLRVTRASHCALVEPVLARFGDAVARVKLAAPGVPYVSCITGAWITDAEATDPTYWVQHLRRAVRFHDALRTLAADPSTAWLEVGPGVTLAGLARRAEPGPAREARVVVASMRRPNEAVTDEHALTRALGRLWLGGVALDWRAVHAGEQRCKVSLPGYPFERQRYWRSLEGPAPGASSARGPDAPAPAAVYGRAEPSTPRVAPRSETEREVLAVWHELLGVAEPDVRDDFFELGGTSLLALRMRSALEQRFGLEVPPRVLIEQPTIAGAARWIDEQRARRGEARVLPTGFVALRPGSERRPLFLVHGAGGSVLSLVTLARALPDDRAVFGIEDVGDAGDPDAPGALARQADRYVAGVRALQASGPYRLAGHSYGGIVALEMAQRLVAAGEAVATLALLDTTMPQDTAAGGSAEHVAAALFSQQLRAQYGRAFAPEDLLGLLHDEARFASARAALFGDDAAALGFRDFRAMALRLVANVGRAMNHAPAAYGARLTYFRARDAHGVGAAYPEARWSSLARGGLLSYVVAGDHWSMLEPPHVEALAVLLGQCLAGAD